MVSSPETVVPLGVNTTYSKIFGSCCVVFLASQSPGYLTVNPDAVLVYIRQLASGFMVGVGWRDGVGEVISVGEFFSLVIVGVDMETSLIGCCGGLLVEAILF